MFISELVLKFNLSPKVKVENEKDLYRFLKQKVFKTAFKIYSFVAKGFPDFVVVKTNYEQLQAGFYEVKMKKGRNVKFTSNQERVLSLLSQGFNVYLVVYDKKEHTVNFFKVKS